MNHENQPQSIKFPAIGTEIQSMIEIDQAMRIKALSDPAFWDETVDRQHTERMKHIVSEIGWPTISKVGLESSYDAWLLVQHADEDLDFQIACLELMKEAGLGEVDILNIVYLADRTQVNQNLGQLYGTQFTEINNQHVPKLIEDETNIDKRRESVGLGPMSEQIEQMNIKYPLNHVSDSK